MCGTLTWTISKCVSTIVVFFYLHSCKYSNDADYFYMRAAHEVVLFIDSLDQLSDRDHARSDISFLKGVNPHPNTVIIVSCLPDERDEGTGRTTSTVC